MNISEQMQLDIEALQVTHDLWKPLEQMQLDIEAPQVTHDLWKPLEQMQLDIEAPQVTHGLWKQKDVAPILQELIETPALKRLKDIHFLGALDFCMKPSPNGTSKAARYTRYEHSSGVVQLAHLYCTSPSIQIQATDRRLVCVAALLHDVGHPPLSHSMEPFFKEEFGIDHHSATENIICGRVSLGNEVFSTLRRHKINIEKLIAVISGECSEFDNFFNGPISFDTIEGILRSFKYITNIHAPTAKTVTKAAIRRTRPQDQIIVDEFWKYKDWVYKYIINSRKGVLSDFACQHFLRKNLKHIDLDCCYGTDTKIFKKLPGLREDLVSNTFINKMIDEIDNTEKPVHYWDRSYCIDSEGDFFDRRDDIRYRHSRALVPLDGRC